ncbi:hypothetical protein P4O66_001972 [Electrophorus voltai]|uniref:Rho/rac guanine nucleotide exchange factor (GEF) 18b n=1 Tax=Electrophorus voltai TaxID=2609070 RepID=A0AAD8ZVN1_9TELE|nr:hypothetical protein P4O66_001972 [Electrophorus voltai]
MELAVRRTRAARGKVARGPASWGLSRREGVRLLLHNDLLTCRFLGAVPGSWLPRYLRPDRTALPTATREPWPGQGPAADGLGRTASGMTVPPRGPGAQPAAANSSSSSQPPSHTSSSSSIAGEMDDVDGFRIKRSTEDAVSLTVLPAESSIVEDAYYANVRAELDTMALDLEAESWSLSVDQHFLKKHSKDLIKRQDVIYGECLPPPLSPYSLAATRKSRGSRVKVTAVCSGGQSSPGKHERDRAELLGTAKNLNSAGLCVCIAELIQTEMHHVRTLKIMLRVYMRELRETLQLDERRLDCLFPRLDSLLDLHSNFLSRLRERRRQSLQADSEHNYVILRVADILTEQFSGDLGKRMKESYGAFCSRHTEAVSYYKEQQQNNKKFQNLIKKISNLPIVRRLGVPECILLVTQRITKYPVLVERILQYTEAGTEEHEEVARALTLIRDTIVQVDAQVSLYKKETRLREIASKTEPKSLGRIKDGRIFSREDLGQGRRVLLHDGTVSWKAASGRLKEILAVLLTDVLVLLQEKDQRYVFSAVVSLQLLFRPWDNKPSVISLQKLIVREVAHEEKAMFLICASSNEPEMYEIHTSSKEERVTWITHIRQAVESCPHTEERLYSEEEGESVLRIREFQERLTVKDAQITQALTEKLQMFAELAETVAGLEDATAPSRSRLLLRSDASDLQQGELLLKGAITEVENLQNLLASGVRGSSPQPEENRSPEPGSAGLPRRADTFGGYDSMQNTLEKNGSVKKQPNGTGKSRERGQRACSDPQLKEACSSQVAEDVDGSPFAWNTIWSNSGFPEAEGIYLVFLFYQFYDRVLMLSQRLYSLQAIVSQQDSQMEVQRAQLSCAEHERLGGRPRPADALLEQEKQRNLEKQREELAQVRRLQAQQRQEQARWERERERQLRQAEAERQRLQEREDACRQLEAHLAEERQEVDRQRQTYQQDLERLREAARAVERDRERLEQQQRRLRKPSAVGHDAGQTRMRKRIAASKHDRRIPDSQAWPSSLVSLSRDAPACNGVRPGALHTGAPRGRSTRALGSQLTVAFGYCVLSDSLLVLSCSPFLESPSPQPYLMKVFGPCLPMYELPFSLSSSFNGELAAGLASGEPGPQPRALVRSSPSVSAADHPERSEALPRRDMEVPIHLISTTNQLHKQAGVQQQIPKKLATDKDKGKAKAKAKVSLRTDSSASVDMKQMFPLKLSSRDSEGSFKGRRSVSPHQQSSPPQATDSPSLTDDYPTELPVPTYPTDLPQPSQTGSLQRAQAQGLGSLYPLPDDSTKEHVIFF